MGQDSSKATNVPTSAVSSEYKPEYEVVKNLNDSKYGQVKLIKEKKDGRELILKEVTTTTKSALDEEVKIVEKAVKSTNSSLIQIVGYNVEESKNFCSSFYRLSVYIESIYVTLFDKLKTSIIIEEADILLIAEKMISCLYQLQLKQISHGDIRPCNIYVKDNNYKLSDPLLNSQRGTTALSAAVIGGYKTLLAPELLARLPKKSADFSSNAYKADVFSLGMTLLSLATLSNSEELYDYDRGVINTTLLQVRLDRVSNSYSPKVHELINDMLDMNESERPDFITLNNKIALYKTSLKSETAFVRPSSTEILDDEILLKIASQIARSQELRANIDKVGVKAI